MPSNAVENLPRKAGAETRKTTGYAAQSATNRLQLFSFERRPPGPKDVHEILYCGICHSDLHTARNEWTNTTYPVVPGHEIVSRASKVGEEVGKFKAGDPVGVGCLADSCRVGPSCRAGLENYCERGPVFTYSSEDKQPGGMTYGDYPQSVVVDEDFVLRIPQGLDLVAAAPLLCAGITPAHRCIIGRSARAESRGGGPGRPGAHGSQAGQWPGRARGVIYHVRAQE